MVIVDAAIARTAATPGSEEVQFVVLVRTVPVNVEEAGPVSMRISGKRAACGRGSILFVINTFGLPLVCKSESITVI